MTWDSAVTLGLGAAYCRTIVPSDYRHGIGVVTHMCILHLAKRSVACSGGSTGGFLGFSPHKMAVAPGK